LYAELNFLKGIDLSKQLTLREVNLGGNQLEYANINSNVVLLRKLWIDNNKLSCIQVTENREDSTGFSWIRDETAYFSTDCSQSPPAYLSDCDLLENIDSDGDGVNDQDDKCPDTASGLEVNEDGCASNQFVYVPDINFEKHLIRFGYDNELDNYVLSSKVKNIWTFLDKLNPDTSLGIDVIKDFTGIEAFESLLYLDIDDNNISELDLTSNSELIELICNNNDLSTIDISQNINLTTLYLRNNNLTQLNLSNNSKLKILALEDNALTQINLLNNLELGHLYAKGNKFDNPEKIILHENIKYVDLRRNLFTSFDGSSFPQLVSLFLDSNPLTELDLSTNLSLEYLSVNDTPLEDIDLSNNINIKTLFLIENRLTDIDLSKQSLLENLGLGSYNGWSFIPSIGSVYGNKNMISELNISSNSKLKALEASNIGLKQIDLSNNKDLERLYLSKNLLKCIDLSKNRELQTINLSYNQLKALDLSMMTNERLSVRVDRNDLKYLSVPHTMHQFNYSNNPNLSCIQIDKLEAPNAYTGNPFWGDPWAITNQFSLDCGLDAPSYLFNCDIDIDNDGVPFAVDDCPETTLGVEVDEWGCEIVYTDSDGDGVIDPHDLYPNTPLGFEVDIEGGVVLPKGSLEIVGFSTTCPSTSSGAIQFNFSEMLTDYQSFLQIEVAGENYNNTFSTLQNNFRLNDLASGTYRVSFSFIESLGKPIEGYKVIVGEAQNISVSKRTISSKKNEVEYTVSGSNKYHIFINNELYQSVEIENPYSTNIRIPLYSGKNYIKIKGENSCQKIYEDEVIVSKEIVIYPNPTNGHIYVEGATDEVQIFNISGVLYYSDVAHPKMKIDIRSFPRGIYYLRTSNSQHKVYTKQIIKK